MIAIEMDDLPRLFSSSLTEEFICHVYMFRHWTFVCFTISLSTIKSYMLVSKPFVPFIALCF